jgi:hypothetical protein
MTILICPLSSPDMAYYKKTDTLSLPALTHSVSNKAVQRQKRKEDQLRQKLRRNQAVIGFIGKHVIRAIICISCCVCVSSTSP